MKPKITIINEGTLNIDTAVYENTDLTLINKPGGTVNLSSSRMATYGAEFLEDQASEPTSTTQLGTLSISLASFIPLGYQRRYGQYQETSSSSSGSNKETRSNVIFEKRNKSAIYIEELKISTNYQGSMDAEYKILEEMRHSHIQFLAERRYSK